MTLAEKSLRSAKSAQSARRVSQKAPQIFGSIVDELMGKPKEKKATRRERQVNVATKKGAHRG